MIKIDLTQMRPGKSGTVVEIHGVHNILKKIQSMGIRPGKKITKVSSHFWQGPQTVGIGKSRVAVGYGMAKKIFVEVEK